jgi:hypothetical protein
MGILFAEQDHPTIALQSLEGFAEDADAGRVFERRFFPQTIGGVALLFMGSGVFGFLAYRAQERGDAGALVGTFITLALASFLVGFALCIVGIRRMSEAVPVSPRSGQPMEAYRLEDTIKEGKYEVIYICRKSRTYFRRVYTEPG